MVAEAEHAAPRRRGLVLGLGLAAVAVISAGAVWFALSLGASGGTEAGPVIKADTIVEAPAPLPSPVAGVELTPGAVTITAGESGELRAFLFDSANVPLGDRSIEWRSSNAGVATVRAGQGVAGVVQAVKAGTARIIALSEGKADTATVTVTAGRASVAKVLVQLQADTLAPGESVSIVAETQDAAGTALIGRVAQWQATPTGIVRIAGGQVIAEKDGTAQLVATSEGVRSTPVRIVVATPAIVSVRVLGAPDSLIVNGSAPLGVEVRDARGRTVQSPAVTWSSSSDTRATVSQGTVMARAAGDVTITATVGGVTGSARIRVVPPPRVAVARLDIRPVSALAVGKASQAGAAALDPNGRPLLDRKVTWSSSNTAVATIAEDGTITAVAPGRTTITAESEGKRQSFELEVPAPEPTTVVEVKPPPVTPVTPAVTAAAIGLGAEVSCAALGDGSALCWGTGAPGRVTELNAQRIVTGSGHACALLANGSVRCWGANASGQLGNGQASRDPVARPAAVATDQVFTSIVAGAAHTCGIARDGSAWCWGENGDGQLGNGRTQDQAAPVAVARGLTFRQLAAGERHTCGIATDGKAHCWGFGFSYALGTGATENQPEPYGVSSRALFKAIAAGKESTCAVTQEGGPVCWGKGFSSSPRAVTTEQQFTQLAVGDEFACGLTGSGAVWCWGRNNRGQLGDGATRNQSTPVRVVTDAVVTSIAAGNAHACGITGDGPTICWGDNAKGQVGAGATGPVPTPVPIEIRR
jgi:alpha-tubulin suppressor-like RCC1 family protein